MLTTSTDKDGITINELQPEQSQLDQITPVPQQELKHLQMAIASDSLLQRSSIRKHMETVGVDVVLSEPLSRLFLRKLERTNAQVLLIDMRADAELDDKLLDELLDNASIPILFNDISALALNEPRKIEKWYKTLVQKIAESTGHHHWQPQVPLLPVKTVVDKAAVYGTGSQDIARHVWVLGASLGGPESVKRFLAALPKEIPAAFIVAQHLGSNFVDLLAGQLDRVTKLQVLTAKPGHVLRHQQVVIAPVNERIILNPIGNIELADIAEPTSYTPSIDMVVADMAKRYQQNAGAIIFSGMENDGMQGCRIMHEHGGQVWTQSAESCIVSSMPDNVARVCGADLRGTPEELAKRLVGHLLMKKVRNS